MGFMSYLAYLLLNKDQTQIRLAKMKALEPSKPGNNIKVLMYHRVLKQKPEKDTKWHYVTMDNFEKQMKLLDKLGYTTVTFADYVLFREGKLTLPKKSIILTFDDGYQDIYDNALPIMQKYNIRAVLFVMGNRRLRSAEWDQKEGEDPCYLMSDDQIKETDSLGFEIGAHSMNHLNLINLSSEELKYEIMRSKSKIESILEKPVYTFSYPYGSVDKRVQEVALNSGYEFACGVYTGPASFVQNTHDIRRIAIKENTGILVFFIRVVTPFQYLQFYYSILKNQYQKLVQLLLTKKNEKVPVEQTIN